MLEVPRSEMNWTEDCGELSGLETSNSTGTLSDQGLGERGDYQGKGPGQGLGLCWARRLGYTVF